MKLETHQGKFTLIYLSVSVLLGGYNVGDQISLEHQYEEFGFCYPESQLGNSVSFAQHNGGLNGGSYQVLMIDMAASW